MVRISRQSVSRQFDSRRGDQLGILAAIGQTPCVRLRRYCEDSNVQLVAKLEAANPGGSAKDRPARQMIDFARQQGLIGDGSTIVESSSGNMGIGLAQVCGYYVLRFICVADCFAQPTNLAIMRALGAEIQFVTEPIDGSLLAARIARVREVLDTTLDCYWPNQYANLQNPLAHHRGTIKEIDDLYGPQLDYLYVAASSTGTARGCRDYLHERGRRTQVIAVDAWGSVLFGGQPAPRVIPGLGAAREPALARGQTFDRVERVTDEDCIVGCRRAANREALLVGGSAGGVLEVIRRDQRYLAGKLCVAILHDSGTRYLDTIFDDRWVESTLGRSVASLSDRIEDQPTEIDAAGVVTHS